jgi:hypothetical protein
VTPDHTGAGLAQRRLRIDWSQLTAGSPQKKLCLACDSLLQSSADCSSSEVINGIAFSKGIVMKKLLLIGPLSILAATLAYSYDIHHPNLKDAYAAAEQAIHHVQEAQAANKRVEFGGHADKAIEHFKQAQAELIEADKYNDAHAKR